MKIIIYTGPQCSLCDKALEVLKQVQHPQFEVEKINIRTSSDLYHLYATRIPVLKLIEHDHANHDQELGWPFSLQSVQDFMQ